MALSFVVGAGDAMFLDAGHFRRWRGTFWRRLSLCLVFVEKGEKDKDLNFFNHCRGW